MLFSRRTHTRLSVAAATIAAVCMTAIAVSSGPAESASNCSAGWVALTYDDGPIPSRTNTVLDALEDAEVPATFFTVGFLVRAYPGTVLKAANDGHVIANHTDQHETLTLLSSFSIGKTLNATDDAIRDAGVEPSRLVRPPYGATNSFVKSVIESNGYEQVLWDVDPQDWTGASAYTIYKDVINDVSDGSVILLHDGNANYNNTATATEMIVSTLHSWGYCFGVLDGEGEVVPSVPLFPACLAEGEAAPDVEVVIVGGPVAVSENLEEYLSGCVAGEVSRSWGMNRYETAAVLADDFFPSGADTVFVVVGDNFPDAMAASPTAGRVGAPVLLTKVRSVPEETLDALGSLAPSQIVVVGGTSVISNTVVGVLSSFAPVTRLAGADRYETAVAVSSHEFVDGADTVFVATGLSYFDALVSGSAAIEAGGPLLLTHNEYLPKSTAAELVRLAPSEVVIVGGTVAVNLEVEDAIAGLLPDSSIERLAGSNRYATSVAAAQAADLDGTHRIFVATDEAFPDGLAAVAAAQGQPLLLVSHNTIHPTVATAVTSLYD